MDAEGTSASRLRREPRHPGTLYPLLKRMEANGWLTSKADPAKGPKAPRAYTITKEGREVLKVVRKQLRELGVEVGKR